MTENLESGNAPQDDALEYNYWAMQRTMTGVLSVDDYDELRDF